MNNRGDFKGSENSFSPKNSIWPMPGDTAGDLLSSKHNLIISSDIINAPQFSSFYIRWVSDQVAGDTRPIYIPKFEVKSSQIQGSYAAVRILEGGGYTDYLSLFSIIKNQGSWIFLTNETAKAESIISASKSAGSRLRVYRLDYEGKLRFHRFVQKPNAPLFALTNTIAPISRIARKERKQYAKGDIVYNSRGDSIHLGNEFISNAQSITYYTDIPNLQAKIFDQRYLTVSYFEDKVRRMIEKPVNMEGICWPVDILINQSGEFVGMLVRSAKGFQLKQLMSQQGLAKCFPEWNRLDLTHLLKIILDKIVFLHDSNILFGVVNPNSIFVEDRDHVYFAEMDTYQIEGYPVLAHDRVMQAPELQGQKEELQLYTKQQDYYEVALLTFMLLMPGKFPYNKGRNKEISKSIHDMTFAFKYGKSGGEHGAREYYGLWRFVWSHLGNDLKQAFYYTFQQNQPFSLPEQRRDARFWQNKIADLERELNNPYDMESLQLFPRTFKRYSGTKTIHCVKCGIDHPDFYYKYPDKKICNSCLGKPSSTSFVCRSCGKTFFYDLGTLFKLEKLVEAKALSMPTHCPYCRSDKQKCVDCGKLFPTYRLNENGRCFDCEKQARERIVKRYVGVCGHEIVLTQGQVDYYMRLGNLPKRCKHCQNERKNRF